MDSARRDHESRRLHVHVLLHARSGHRLGIRQAIRHRPLRETSSTPCWSAASTWRLRSSKPASSPPRIPKTTSALPFPLPAHSLKVRARLDLVTARFQAFALFPDSTCRMTRHGVLERNQENLSVMSDRPLTHRRYFAGAAAPSLLSFVVSSTVRWLKPMSIAAFLSNSHFRAACDDGRVQRPTPSHSNRTRRQRCGNSVPRLSLEARSPSRLPEFGLRCSDSGR